MTLFVRITALAALGIVALILVGFLVKIVFVAALVAALVVGVVALNNLFRRRRGGPVMTYSARR